MFSVAAEQDLYRSCEIIFGVELNVNRDFLEYLRPSGLKSAYRKRALETHPDMALARGENDHTGSTPLFRAVQEAYENLSTYLYARERGFRFPGHNPRPNKRKNTPAAGRSHSKYTSSTRSFRSRKAGGERNGERFKRNGEKAFQETGFENSRKANGTQNGVSSKQNSAGDTIYTGPLPARKLLIGHFLYYSGVISWRTIIQALVWQRSQRPKVGEIARTMGYLTHEDIIYILQKRKFLQPFGESAVRLGFLSRKQLNTIVARQKRLQKKFGVYFTENNLMTQRQLSEFLCRCRLHNARTSVTS